MDGRTNKSEPELRLTKPEDASRSSVGGELRMNLPSPLVSSHFRSSVEWMGRQWLQNPSSGKIQVQVWNMRWKPCQFTYYSLVLHFPGGSEGRTQTKFLLIILSHHRTSFQMVVQLVKYQWPELFRTRVSGASKFYLFGVVTGCLQFRKLQENNKCIGGMSRSKEYRKASYRNLLTDKLTVLALCN